MKINGRYTRNCCVARAAAERPRMQAAGAEKRQRAVWSKLKTDKPAMSRRATFIYVTMSGAHRRATASPSRLLLSANFSRGVLRVSSPRADVANLKSVIFFIRVPHSRKVVFLFFFIFLNVIS
ncbi:hypothetical protein PUN28_009508 [Cardiocondyla obscurior]|uniref:Uncharacterized protein n=1 Tax=Cardiocondyla obscurior TaxID=286306 RepID=A0AAW2FTX9_9HYME